MTTEYENIDDFANNVTNTLYECAATSRCAQDVQNVDNNLGGWERSMEDKDNARIWKAINWKGELGVNYNEYQRPTDQEIEFFGNTLNLQINLEL